MNKIKVAKIWVFYFLSGFTLLQIHFLRYLNSFITGYTPWADKKIDYDFLTPQGLFIRFLCFAFSLFLFKIRGNKPIAATSLAWTLSFILLSNEHDKYTFWLILFICLICYSICIYSFFKNRKISWSLIQNLLGQ